MSSNSEAPAQINHSPSTATKNSGTDDEQPEDKLPEHWTKIASKNRPGKFYYFNSKTRESLWQHPTKTKALAREQDIIRHVAKGVGSSPAKEIKAESEKKADKKIKPVVGSKKVVHLKNDAKFKKKNLAKERMEGIQKQLALEREAMIVKGGSGTAKQLKKESPQKKQEGKTISPIKSVKTPSKVKKAENPSTKSQNSSDLTPTKVEVGAKVRSKARTITKKPPPATGIKRKEEHVEKAKNEFPILLPKNKELSKFKIPKKPVKELVSSSLLNNISKQEVRQLTGKESNTNQNSTKIETSSIVNNKTHTTDVLEQKQSPSGKDSASTCFETSVEALDVSFSSPRAEIVISSRVSEQVEYKSPANDRLARFREELHQEVALQSSLLDEDAEMTDLSDCSANVSQLGNVEGMDWEDIPEEVALSEVVSIRRALGFKLAASDDNENYLHASIPEYKTHLFDQISFQRYFFMVLDTNIFLSNSKGVEDFLRKGFPHIGQPIIIVPYIVLQELDRIKHREQGRPLSQAASRSIRFLNEHLKTRDPRVKGQSTIDAANAIIPIENPDDNIINCCLQVQQIIANSPTELMLLSNDVNLRNKSLVNGVQAFSFSELSTEADRIRFASDDHR
ncbi:transcriptional protein SWT1 [Toxorhynchites rutilus septentrionalis]|uniref:transcriptional protein SWT1 n=1 Tax=Toxorhynchites rutilus septentrionalis TaxID=329112 RepID=UPI0024791D34|nr:transcriptional protein SWT1 [Toxorhynchites rutilus septentrionalis]